MLRAAHAVTAIRSGRFARSVEFQFQLQTLLRQHRAGRTSNLEHDLPLSWAWVFIAVFSYTLLLSDVLRTGMAVRSLPYAKLEPNQVMSFGPYAYPVVHILYNETIDGVHDVWTYKYDSTSIGMRALADHLSIEHWPPCVLYKTECPARSITFSSIFHMLDALMTAVAEHKSARLPKNLTLRTRNTWIDRIHHFVLPWIFDTHMTRTTQAIYYDAEMLSAPDFQFCYSSAHRVYPYACIDFWTNFTPICRASNKLCQGIGRAFDHAVSRYRSLQKRYPGKALDLVMLESHDDHSKASLSFQGRKWLDVVFITRVRDCSGSTCATIAIDDYRYEGVSLTSSVEDSFFVIAILRCLGQMYMWVRVSMLFVGCYYARSTEPRFAQASVFRKVIAGVRTAFLVPSQVVTYGSVFPIVCYVTAHTLDSAMVYELVSQKFNSPLGVFKLDPEEFLQLSAVSMRSVWVLATVLHVIVYLRTRNHWSQARGVPGIPEFLITFISCLTIMAQFRSVYFRNSHVTAAFEVVPSARMATKRAYTYDNLLGTWALVIRGNTLDAKCLIGSAAAHVLVFFVVWSILSMLNRVHSTKRFALFAMPRTRVSYAASTLWSANALVISWSGPQLHRSGSGPQTAVVREYARLHEHKLAHPKPQRSVIWRRAARVSPVQLQETGRLLRHEFAQLDERSSEVESIVYLMNLTVLTDPIALVLVLRGRSTRICVLRSRTSHRIFLVPQDAVRSPHDVSITWSDYDLVLTVSTRELLWQDLLHCG